jgi:hypothetical protein
MFKRGNLERYLYTLGGILVILASLGGIFKSAPGSRLPEVAIGYMLWFGIAFLFVGLIISIVKMWREPPEKWRRMKS